MLWQLTIQEHNTTAEYWLENIDLCNKKKIGQVYVTSFHLPQLLALIEHTSKNKQSQVTASVSLCLS